MTSTPLAITVPPATASEAALAQAEAEALETDVAGLRVTDAESDSLADEALSEVKRRAKAATEMRDAAIKPLNAVVATIRGWFAPTLAALDSAERHLKAERGSYRLKLENIRREAEAAALAAAKSADDSALLDALETRKAVTEAKGAARGNVRFVWKVKTCNTAAMRLEDLIPDSRKLDAIARAHKGETPPIVPGVEFEREAVVSGRR